MPTGLGVEAPNVRMARVAGLSDLGIERALLVTPFEKSERRGFLRRQKDLAFIRFTQPLWRRLTEADKQDLLNAAAARIGAYYRRIEGRGGGN